MASLQAAGGAVAHSVVMGDAQADPALADSAPAGSAMTFVAPVSDHPPPLDRAPPGSDGGVSEPPPKQHPADMALHPASVDFTYTPEPVALHPFIVDTEEWPAFRSTPWVPPTIGASADRPAAADQNLP
ncbi:hypothetical protein CYMTET_9082 [Cymbomonas tetramitiformis]|uniref:Uncharacterized protein n=1 Tax=Cymbomonas tetramitiformis TaxID=36881 RepID=A0AAE0GS86_9CHLO|nr:hypothetical protein CYMTET_9081 [Cymbomonas tetramitiformis]KAK3283213.1 hypothetical protein CYMTET_9082 [Cymbomonas tetramitiformis]